MASFDSIRPVAAGHLISTGFSKFVWGLVGSIAAWNDARVTRNALSKLSNHELDDLGLTRGDVEAMRALTRRF